MPILSKPAISNAVIIINLTLIYRHFLYLRSMEKIDFRTVSEFERLALRKRAIRLIVSGTRKGVVADLIGVRPNTVEGISTCRQQRSCI